ncbi:hypothetical protein, partial [Thermus sp.]|uniref:hypothetical protein n=1 Tax=Thermus sp. TaxID=275 RepID=UPI0026261DBC
EEEPPEEGEEEVHRESLAGERTPALGLLLLGFRLPGSPLQGIGLAVALAGGTVLAEEGRRGLGAAVGAVPFLQALERALRMGFVDGKAHTLEVAAFLGAPPGG